MPPARIYGARHACRQRPVNASSYNLSVEALAASLSWESLPQLKGACRAAFAAAMACCQRRSGLRAC